jgi:hypothetical protein
MEKKALLKDYILSIIIFIVVVLAVVWLIKLTFVYTEKINEYEYDKLKQDSIEYLDKNIDELKEYATLVLETKPHKCPSFNGISYCYDSDNSVDIILYELEEYKNYRGQQYWGIIYSEEDILNGKDMWVYDRKKEEGYGHLIELKIKIRDNWYFHYTDYDYDETDKISDYVKS